MQKVTLKLVQMPTGLAVMGTTDKYKIYSSTYKGTVIEHLTDAEQAVKRLAEQKLGEEVELVWE